MKISIELPNTNNLKLHFYYRLIDNPIELNVLNDIKILFTSFAKFLSAKISTEPYTILESDCFESDYIVDYNKSQIKTMTLSYFLSTDAQQIKKLKLNIYYNNWTSLITEKVLTNEHLFPLSQFSFDNLDMIVQIDN